MHPIPVHKDIHQCHAVLTVYSIVRSTTCTKQWASTSEIIPTWTNDRRKNFQKAEQAQDYVLVSTAPVHPCFFSDFCNITNFTNLSLDPEHLSALNTPEHFLMFVHQSHSSLNIPDILVGGNLPMLIFFPKLLVPIAILFSVELKNWRITTFFRRKYMYWPSEVLW